MRFAIVTCALFLMFACGGAKQNQKQSTPLTPEQTAAYDHGVDFVTTLEGIEGRWRDDWERDLSVRVASSDLIALVTIRTLRTDTDPEQRVTYRLLGSIDRELVGKAAGNEVELMVRADQLGFTSVHQNQGRLANQQFVAYVKSGGEGVLHWHLAPASEQVLTETEGKISQLAGTPKGTGERTVVHTN
jgi:hypothetical protein